MSKSLKAAQRRVVVMGATVAMQTDRIAMLTAEHPAGQKCAEYSKRLKDLEPRDDSDEALDAWEAECDALIEEMRPYSDELEAFLKSEHAVLDQARAKLREAETDLLVSAKNEMPKQLGRPLPADVVKLYDDAIEAKLSGVWRDRIVQTCLDWSVR